MTQVRANEWNNFETKKIDLHLKKKKVKRVNYSNDP